MGWRKKMKSESPTKNPINSKNLYGEGVSSVSRVNSKGSENENGYPIPTKGSESTMDELQAIIDVNGGPIGEPSYPVAVKMKSVILGGEVDVSLWPDRAEVAGVEYSKNELVGLLSRKLHPADLMAVHHVKQEFEGEVKP